MSSLVVLGRIAIRAPHGVGKSATAALLVLWFALTRDDDPDADWKIPTTASAWRQLKNFLWPEIHKWTRRLRWNKMPWRPKPFDTRTELMSLSLKLSSGEAFAAASDTPWAIEGAHARHLLYVFDEAKAIPASLFDAAEGAFAAPSLDRLPPSEKSSPLLQNASPTSKLLPPSEKSSPLNSDASSLGDDGWRPEPETLAFCISTPGEPSGRFYDIHAHKKGYEDWHPRHIKLEEAIAAGRISREWAEQRKLQWGEVSSVYQNRVLGEFASEGENSTIPLGWVELANERWLEREDEARRPGPLTAIGLDVARGGTAQTVYALLAGDLVKELRKHSGEDTMQTTGRLIGLHEAYGGALVVDVNGIGASVVDRGRELRAPIIAFVAAGKPEHAGVEIRDRSGELGFVNIRAAAWWNLREMLDPAFGATLALPPDDELIGELVAPRWKIASGGKILIESKEEIYERLNRSTDSADAVVQACFYNRVGMIGKRPLAFV